LQRCRPFLCLENIDGPGRLLKRLCENRWFDLSGQIFENLSRGLHTRIFREWLASHRPPVLTAVKMAHTDARAVDRPHHTADDSTGF
jgi:hypothetical protein